MNATIKKVCLIMLCIFIGLFSFTKLSKITTDPEFSFNKTNIESFDEKIHTVMGLSAGSAIASTAISLIPGDAGTPIADQLADFSKYFLLVLSALFFEQYFALISGFIVSYIVIPAICILLILYLIFNNVKFKEIAVKLLLAGIIIYLIVPCTVQITNLVSNTYEETIAEAQNNELSSTDVEDTGVLSQLANSAEATISNAGNYLSQLIRALAVMVVVTCLIPILILVLAFWLLKIIITQNYSVPSIIDIKYLLEKHSEENEA